MDIEELYDYCMSVKGSEATTPFDETTIVIKVMDKMFALIPTENTELSITLKCDPEKAVELREKYMCVEAAYHMNKTYWNTIFLDGTMDDSEIKYWIDHSVDEVIKKLSKKKKTEYYGTSE
jgi:predicted DNA-binding protein (MmcQ/YjbR family)